jgi:hypothetical protein
VTAYEMTHEDQAGWQRRAAAELGRILAAHRGLPMIAWTVGPAGASLTGQVSRLAPAGRVRASFELWRAALALDTHPEAAAGGVVYLRAAGYRNRVHVGLAAAVFDDGEG